MDSPTRSESAARGAAWRATAGFLAFGLAIGIALIRGGPPEPLGAESDPARPAAGRARAVLTRILGDERPHPVGTAAHAAVLERLVGEMRALGLEPAVEDALARGRSGVVTRVRNVVARIEGTAGGDTAIALASHHDSVAAGPGAADDGAGVAAALEVVRALRHGAPLGHDLVLLVTDGEEVDLSGASAFVGASPSARGVRAVVNLEARGTSGRAYLFQTGPGVGDAIARFGALAPDPATSSIAAFVYDLLPNDTDLTVFLGAGWTGLNLAFIGGLRRYHTPRDDLAHLDDGSLQQLADGALAAVRALDGTDLGRPHSSRGDRVWHDVLGAFVVSWPRGASAPLAALAVVMLAVAARRMRTTPRELLVGALLFAGAVSAAAALAGVLALLAAMPHDAPDPWFADLEAWGLLGRFAALLGAVLAASLPFARRTRRAALVVGGWFVVAAVALLVALLWPAACPPLVAPALLAGIAALALGRAPGEARTAAVAITAFLGGASLWLPFLQGIEEAIGYAAGFAPGALAGLAAAALAPLFVPARRDLLIPAAVLALGTAFFAAREPDRSPDHPVPTNVIHVESDAEAHLVVQLFGQRPPAELAAREPAPGRPEAWSGLVPSGLVLPAARLAHAAPTATVEPLPPGPAGARWRVALRSPRGAPAFAVRLPEGLRVEELRSGDLVLRDPDAVGPGFHAAGIGPEGLDLVVTGAPAAPRQLQVADFAPGLPAGVEAPLAPDPARVPRGRGHGSVVATTIPF